MATVNQDLKIQFKTTKDGDMEDVVFKKGDTVSIVQTWSRHYLVKDSNGHYYNLPKDKITP